MELKGKISLYKDGKKTILVIDDDSPNMEEIVSSILFKIFKESSSVTEIEGLSPVVENEDPVVVNPDAEYTPDFLTETITETPTETETPDIGDHIITMGKYKDHGLSIKAIWEKDANWLKWVAEKSTSRHGDVEKVKTFVATHT
jgi:hypothetical protein